MLLCRRIRSYPHETNPARSTVHYGQMDGLVGEAKASKARLQFLAMTA